MFPWDLNWELVEPQPSSFSKKGAHVWTVTQEEMRSESSPAKAPPLSRRRMMPPTPLKKKKKTYSSFEEAQGHFEVEFQIWSACDRTVVARTEQYLESVSMQVEVEELESLLGPEDSEVDFRRILEQARNKQGRVIFERGRVIFW